ncbi:MAG: bifunctional diaminohydroxyphosphoribosylaminopyrimidine deaminase/5-amino-6-(5-phosphoribosylamino)uracil reductase RibD [Actinomycetota bacterium]|nr:bifunctional diaminohydroxyphosphoribosylaminopyrimidine deaminase/5-amino-6-(5-phosphoribosylamino)uracil reductase RibD [Actinomycetota bacterium]
MIFLCAGFLPAFFVIWIGGIWIMGEECQRVLYRREKVNPSNEEERFMLRAIRLAEGGRGFVSPNPLVGAVVVSDGDILGEGCHQYLGGDHAEVIALRNAGGGARGATLYVTLEPCSHQGRTPPCVDRIIRNGIGKVVMAMVDPNPLVNGFGKRKLEENGVETVIGPYGELVRRQNESYVKFMSEGMPFVTLKMALSIDGKSATRTGDSRWITSKESRRDAHRLRLQSDAIMVGIGTVLSDDPKLTARFGHTGKQPLRVIVDSMARTPVKSKLVSDKKARTIIATTEGAPDFRKEALRKSGVEVVTAGEGPRVDLRVLLDLLAKRGVTSLVVEGGAELAHSIWAEGLADKLVLYISPKVIGGREAPGCIGGMGIERIAESGRVKIEEIYLLGEDLKIVAYPVAQPVEVAKKGG